MNKDQKVIEDFGDEWTDFTYENKTIGQVELVKNFNQYFHFMVPSHGLEPRTY